MVVMVFFPFILLERVGNHPIAFGLSTQGLVEGLGSSFLHVPLMLVFMLTSSSLTMYNPILFTGYSERSVFRRMTMKNTGLLFTFAAARLLTRDEEGWREPGEHILLLDIEWRIT